LCESAVDEKGEVPDLPDLPHQSVSMYNPAEIGKRAIARNESASSHINRYRSQGITKPLPARAQTNAEASLDAIASSMNAGASWTHRFHNP